MQVKVPQPNRTEGGQSVSEFGLNTRFIKTMHDTKVMLQPLDASIVNPGAGLSYMGPFFHHLTITTYHHLSHNFGEYNLQIFVYNPLITC